MKIFSTALKAYGKNAALFNTLCLIVGLIIVANAASATEIRKIVAFGDSLTAGYGLPAADAFPTRLQQALQDKGYSVTVENAGVSGDTSTGGAQRLDWAIAGGADAVLLELGANDALRGIEPAITEQNLESIIARLKAKGIPVFLTGMQAPPNMGASYTSEFDSIFPRLAEKHGLAFYPFFLDGVAAEPDLNQEDAIHPNAKGVDIIVARMLPYVTAFLDQHRQSK